MPEPTPVPVPEPTPTPPVAPVGEPLGEPGKAALEAERRDRKAAEKRAKELEERLQAIEDKDKTELEKAQARITELERNHETERAQRMRLQVATEHAIPAEFLDLLTGSDEEALKVQAERLATLIKGAPPVPPAPAGPLPGQGTPPATPTATVAAGAALYAQHKQKT